MKISFDLEITPEGIFSIIKSIDDKIVERVTPCIIPDIPQTSYIGKSVKIKSSTPDSEIESWNRKLERNIVYGVTEHDKQYIMIRQVWYPKVWFELVG